jgi:hypothetical protein
MAAAGVEAKALMLVGSLAEAKECKLCSSGCDVQSRVANGPVVMRLGEELYATALEKHVNEWCLSLAEKALFIQL